MVAANGIYKLAVIGSVLGQQHVHTLHFRSGLLPAALTDDEPTYMQALIDLWRSGCRTAYRAIFGTGDSPCVSYQARKECGTVPLPAGLDVAESVGSILGTGSKTGDALAPWLAHVVTERTALAGRRYRGRFFLGGLWEGDQNFGAIVTARLTLAQTYADALKTTFIDPVEGSARGKLFVYSRVQAAVAGTPCQNAGADVRTLQVRDALATMKSRKAGSGI